MTTTPTRRLTLVLGLTLLLAAPFSAAAAEPSPGLFEGELFTPAPQPMGECITCQGSYDTDMHWGMGSDCNAALQNLQSQVGAAANAFCDTVDPHPGAHCNGFLTIVTQCWYKSETGQFVVDGFLTHGCWVGDFFCPEW